MVFYFRFVVLVENLQLLRFICAGFLLLVICGSFNDEFIFIWPSVYLNFELHIDLFHQAPLYYFPFGHFVSDFPVYWVCSMAQLNGFRYGTLE